MGDEDMRREFSDLTSQEEIDNEMPERPLTVPLVLFMAVVGLGMTCAAIYHWMTFGG